MRAPTVITPAVTTTAAGAAATKNAAENGKSVAAIGGPSHAHKSPAPLQWASSRYIISDHQPTTPAHHSTNGVNGVVLESVSRTPAAAPVLHATASGSAVGVGGNRHSGYGAMMTSPKDSHRSPHHGQRALLSPTMTHASSPSPSPQQQLTTIVGVAPVIVVQS